MDNTTLATRNGLVLNHEFPAAGEEYTRRVTEATGGRGPERLQYANEHGADRWREPDDGVTDREYGLSGKMATNR